MVNYSYDENALAEPIEIPTCQLNGYDRVLHVLERMRKKLLWFIGGLTQHHMVEEAPPYYKTLETRSREVYAAIFGHEKAWDQIISVADLDSMMDSMPLV